MATSPPTGSKFSKRKISRLPGKDEFLHSEITKFVGTRRNRSTAPIGLPEAVPLVQYGEQLRDAATAVKSSHPESPPPSIAVADSASEGAQPASLVETQPSPVHLNTENLEVSATDGESPSTTPAPVIKGEIEDDVKDQVEGQEQVEDEAVEDQVRDEVQADVEDKAMFESEDEFEREVENEFANEAGSKALAPAPATVTARVALVPEPEPAPPLVAAGPLLVREITLPSLSTLADNTTLNKPPQLEEESSTTSSSATEAASQEMAPVQEESSGKLSVGEGASRATPQAEEQARRGSGLKLTFALKVDAEGLSGDVERYGGSSWGTTSLTAAGTNDKHIERLGESEPLVRGVVQLSPDSPEMESATQDNGETMGIRQHRHPLELQTERSPRTDREGNVPLFNSNAHNDEDKTYSNADDDGENSSNNDYNNSNNGNTNPPEAETARPGASPMNKQEKEMIRWFRSHPFGREIDCDFKLRHKIANGYLIGACLAYYHRGKIDKVDFNRGNGPANKIANWEFVQKFLRRRGYSLCQKDVECLCTVPMPAEKGVASAYRVLSQLYSFLLADDLVPPVAGVKAARLQPLPARPKVPIYKRFTDRRRSDVEEEMMAPIVSKDGNPYSSGDDWRRSSSVPVASNRTRASFASSEEFDRSRRRDLGEMGGTDDRRVDEQNSDGRHRRRRSKDAGQGSIDKNPALGQYGTGGKDDVGVRGLTNVDHLGERRSGARGGDGRFEVATLPYDKLREGVRGGGVVCAGCGLCNFPERMANSSRREGAMREGEDRVRPLDRGEGSRVARERTGASGGRQLGRTHAPPTSSCSSSESEGRRRRPLRRRRGSVSEDYDNDGHDPSRGYPRDGYGDELEREASMGHRSDPSGGRGKREYNRRQRRLRQREGYQRDDTLRYHGRDECYHDHRTDNRTWRGDHRHREAEGYHGEGDSSSEDEGPRARRRRARREGAAGATFTGMSPGREPHASFGVKKGARHREEHRCMSHSGHDHDDDTHGTHDRYHPDTGGGTYQSHRQAGKPFRRVNVRDSHPQRQRGEDKGRSKHTHEASVEAYSQPVSTPRRRAAKADPTSPPELSGLAWRGTRRRERGWHTENTESGGHGYPSLPPAALPEGRRRPRDNATSVSGRNHRSEEARPSRRAKPTKDDFNKREDWSRKRANPAKGSAGGLDDIRLGGNGKQERQGRTAAEESLGKRGNGRDYGGDGGGGGEHTRPPGRQHNPPERISPRAKKDVLPGSPHGARRRQAKGENRGTGGGISNGDRGQAAAVAAAAADVLSKTPKQGRARSLVSNKAPLEKMSGFGYGDRGWSERVEGRRRQQLMKRDQGAGSMAAEVDGESGRIQPVLAPSAPPGPLVGQHQQAVSPPRLRRLVHAEGPRLSGGPTPPRSGSNLTQQTSAVPKAIVRNKMETPNARHDAAGHQPGRHQDQPQRPQQIPPTRIAPKRAGFNSYADDGAAGVEVGVRWG